MAVKLRIQCSQVFVGSNDDPQLSHHPDSRQWQPSVGVDIPRRQLMHAGYGSLFSMPASSASRVARGMHGQHEDQDFAEFKGQSSSQGVADRLWERLSNR